jgi:hypothetical protein
MVKNAEIVGFRPRQLFPTWRRLMRHSFYSTWLVLATGVFLGDRPAVRGGDDFKPEPGFVGLFNGKDLTGWRLGKADLAGKTESAGKRFYVHEGVIVIPGKGGGDLYTTKEFNTDFHLKLEFRAAKRADSGVFIRGPQLQVRDYPTVGPYRNLKKFKDADWNELDIRVTGTAALCTCNGEVLEKAFRVGKKGGIGLQSESGRFEFRRIRIKEMP